MRNTLIGDGRISSDTMPENEIKDQIAIMMIKPDSV
jgi:hypothetical protein